MGTVGGHGAGKVLTAVSTVNEQCPSASVGCPVCTFLPVCPEAAELEEPRALPGCQPVAKESRLGLAGGAEEE